jgi:(1->4)-alpha-D-glucan 1-alpha-D-glucosylmutase
LLPAVPRATYRLQLSAKFGFDDAAAIVPYLRTLGISHLYTSPFLKSRAGSTHGYDIIDHHVLNPEYGGEAGFARLSNALARADMGLILDFVPNHMGVGHADNSWWLDVLEWGPKSPFAATFDIDWSMLPFRSHAGLLLPILGKPYGEALEQGEIELRYDSGEGSFSFWYFDHRLPVRPDRYSEIIAAAVANAGASGTAAGDALLAIAQRYSALNSPSRTHAPAMKSALAAVEGGSATIEKGLVAYEPRKDDTTAVASLHRLLERQHYRLAHWQVAISEINYRRFFDINDLAGIRVEDIRTFRLVHAKVAELIAAGKLHGLRLDHIDGLYDPAQYCARLQRMITAARGTEHAKSFYTVVEKILAPEETMPKFTGVSGTTGYDALNLISRIMVDGKGLPVLEATWQTQASPSRNFAQIVDDAKTRIVETTMASEFTVLAHLLARIAAGHWRSRDYTLDRLSVALKLFVRNFPVYRTYIADGRISDADRGIVLHTIGVARAQWYGSDIAIFDFLRDVLTLDLVAPDRSGYSAARAEHFVGKLQQFTGPVTAKAVEDTAFYRYHRLLALNEVGNDPSLPALSIPDFHRAMEQRAAHYPHAMTATATHDTKRGEDARARIAALSEIPDDWNTAVRRWTEINARLVDHGKSRSPSRAHEYMLYQALIGSWPADGAATTEFAERLAAYAVKAAREGKDETSWLDPNSAYEDGLKRFVHRALDRNTSGPFLDDFAAFVHRTTLLGALNGITQLVLKATMPGIPDFYQGTELEDLSLVDPDNRRAVDFRLRERLIGGDGAADKVHLTQRLLAIRAQNPALFSDGQYQAIAVEGPHRDHLIAFARTLGPDAVIVAVGCHYAAFTSGGRTALEVGAIDATLLLDRYRISHNLLGDVAPPFERTAPVAALFGKLPAAILLAAVR